MDAVKKVASTQDPNTSLKDMEEKVFGDNSKRGNKTLSGDE